MAIASAARGSDFGRAGATDYSVDEEGGRIQAKPITTEQLPAARVGCAILGPNIEDGVHQGARKCARGRASPLP